MLDRFGSTSGYPATRRSDLFQLEPSLTSRESPITCAHLLPASFAHMGSAISTISYSVLKLTSPNRAPSGRVSSPGPPTIALGDPGLSESAFLIQPSTSVH